MNLVEQRTPPADGKKTLTDGKLAIQPLLAALETGNDREAAALANGLLTEDVAAKDELLRLSNRLLEAGRHDQAAMLAMAMADRLTDDEDLQSLTGLRLVMLQRMEEALKYLFGAVRLNPENAIYNSNLGKALFLTGKHDQARPYLLIALEKASDAAAEELRSILAKCAPAQALPPMDTLIEQARSLPHGFAAAGAILPESWLINTVNDPPPPRMPAVSDQDTAALKGVRILHGPSEITGNIKRITTLLRKYGIDATGLNYGYNQWANFQCDINLNLMKLDQQTSQKVVMEFYRKAIKEYDIFHFHYGRSLLPDMSDLPVLKDRGKKIVVSYWGSDNRSEETYFYHQACFLGHKPPQPYFLSLQTYQAQKMMNQYADVIYGCGCLPRGEYISGTADPSLWTPEDRDRNRAAGPVKSNDKLYIVHAPSNPRFKGSFFLKKLLDECVHDGMPIEMVTVHGLPLDEAKKLYAMADVALDQVGGGTFGLFGIEMMCWEIPLLCYVAPGKEKVHSNPPIINITKDTFKDKIQFCLDLKKRGVLREFGQAGRQWALRYADTETMGLPRYVDSYISLVNNFSVPQYINNDWFRQEAKLQQGVKSDFFRFMIENNVFSEIGQDVPNYDKRLYN